jgi:tetratricopeptide (TPR) repeat protein
MGRLLLLTSYCAIRSRESAHRRWWEVGAIAACALATGSKQTAAMAPLLLPLYDYTFPPDSAARWHRAGLYVAVAAPAWIMLMTIAGKAGRNYQLDEAIAYAIAQPGVILHYLRLSVWPDALFVYVNTHLFDVHAVMQVLPQAVALAALLTATIWGVARRHWLGFLGAWFFVTLGPTSSIIRIADTIQEHRMYVPLAALAVLAVVAGDAGLRAVLSPRVSRGAQTLVRTMLLGAVLLGLGARTYARNWDYHHEFTMVHPADLHESYRILADHALSQPGLLEAEAERAGAVLASPDRDARDTLYAHFVLALASAQRGELEPAASEFERVLHLDPKFAYAHQQLGALLVERGDLPGAIEHLEEAIRLEPDFLPSYKDLAVALKKRGDRAGAEERLELALDLQPDFAEARYELGIIAAGRGDREAAAKHFERAIRDRPDFAEAHCELGALLRDQAQVGPALHHLREAVRLRPDLARPHRELGVLLIGLGEEDQAAAHLEEALRLKPDYPQAYSSLGLLWRARGDLARAMEYLEKALRLRPDDHEALYILAMVLCDRGDFATAVKHLERAVELMPEFAEARSKLAQVRLKIAETTPGAAADPAQTGPNRQ